MKEAAAAVEVLLQLLRKQRRRGWRVAMMQSTDLRHCHEPLEVSGRT